MLWDKMFSGEMEETYVLTPNSEPIADQSTDTPEIWLDKSMSFIGITYRNRIDSKTTVSPKPTSAK